MFFKQPNAVTIRLALGSGILARRKLDRIRRVKFIDISGWENIAHFLKPLRHG